MAYKSRTLKITLFEKGRLAVQSEGMVTVDYANKHVHYGRWVYGGTHVRRMPLGLIRRVALGCKSKSFPCGGFDQTTGVQYHIDKG